MRIEFYAHLEVGSTSGVFMLLNPRSCPTTRVQHVRIELYAHVLEDMQSARRMQFYAHVLEEFVGVALKQVPQTAKKCA